MEPSTSSQPHPTTTRVASSRPLPKTPFYAIEYPGFIAREPEAMKRAVDRLGGPQRLDSSLRSTGTSSRSIGDRDAGLASTSSGPTKAPVSTMSTATAHATTLPVELRLRPEAPWAHPIPADTRSTSNLLLKVVTRRKKNRNAEEEGAAPMDIDHSASRSSSKGKEKAHDPSTPMPEYTAEVVGLLKKTVRFRSMADFQYAPPLNDRVSNIRAMMDRMDARAMQNFTFEPEQEDYYLDPDLGGVEPPNDGAEMDVDEPPNTDAIKNTPKQKQPDKEEDRTGPRSNLRLFPPPVFSRQALPHPYNYKPNPVSIVQTVTDEVTGEEKQRMVNKHSLKAEVMHVLSADDEGIVETASETALEGLKKSPEQDLIAAVKKWLDERPVWSRIALFNQFSRRDAKELQTNKTILAGLCYGYRDGPFWGTFVRIGFDPRKDRSSYRYQRMYFRDMDRVAGRMGLIEKQAAAAKERERETNAPRKAGHIGGGAYDEWRHPESHIFDGQNLISDATSFQVMDITDPTLKAIMDDPANRRDKFDARDGWFKPDALDRIKALFRHKLFLLRSPNDPRALTEEESQAWYEEESIRFVRTARIDGDDDGDANAGGGTGRARGSATVKGKGKKNRAKAMQDDVQQRAARIRAQLEQE
ncbi:hypothetical protein DL93DRAFT_2077675 [Clavulina sp. PMI_390]|nr:hypothetical protein DL93DRAFT_2077675 [Clavulina sp. PMI_390]